jgi:hypothetical protein
MISTSAHLSLLVCLLMTLHVQTLTQILILSLLGQTLSSKDCTWFRANMMAVNNGKTKYIIFHYKGKHIDMNEREVVYDNNEPFAGDPHLVAPLEHYHKDHPLPECRAYKLLGIYEYLDKNLSFLLSHYFLLQQTQ